MTSLYTMLSVIFVSLLSLIGAALVTIQRKNLNTIITYALAVSSGVMLGATFLIYSRRVSHCCLKQHSRGCLSDLFHFLHWRN